jgi:hypothetical protein
MCFVHQHVIRFPTTIGYSTIDPIELGNGCINSSPMAFELSLWPSSCTFSQARIERFYYLVLVGLSALICAMNWIYWMLNPKTYKP